MPSPSALPLEARRAAWARLWQILLREPSNDESEPREPEPGSECAETSEAATSLVLKKEVSLPGAP